MLREWVAHYNRGRPHASLGLGIPDGADTPRAFTRHRIRKGHRVVAAPIVGGLHYEYYLPRETA